MKKGLSSSLDAYLKLFDPKGQNVAEDDDSGGGLDARIVYTPQVTGRFRIMATTYRPNETGA